MEIHQWVKNHKKEFVKRFIRESGAEPNSENPSCIYMAGLPGAGKTEFTKKIITELNTKVIRIDMDEIASQIESYKPEDADKFRYGASTLQDAIFDKCNKLLYPFIMDGTLSKKKTMDCIKRSVNRKYNIKVIYIQQDPLLAWRFTKARELVEKRGIEKTGFIESYASTINNLYSLKEYAEIKVDIIIKNKRNETGKRIMDIPSGELDKYIKIEYNNKQLERLLRNE